MSADDLESNRAHWDALAAVHGQDDYYDADGLIGGASTRSRSAVTTEIVYAHSLGEIVTAAIEAGLRVDALHEHLETDFDPRGDVLARSEDGRYRLPLGDEQLPVLFTLLATRAR